MSTKLNWRRVGTVDLGDGLGSVNYSSCKYVHPIFGNDQYGDGTPQNPYKTFSKVVQVGSFLTCVVSGYIQENCAGIQYIGVVYGDGWTVMASYGSINGFRLRFVDVIYIGQLTYGDFKYVKGSSMVQYGGGETYFDHVLALNLVSKTFMTFNQSSWCAKSTLIGADLNSVVTFVTAYSAVNNNNIFSRTKINFLASTTIANCIFHNVKIGFNSANYELYDNTTIGSDGLVNNLTNLRTRAKVVWGNNVAGAETLFVNCVIKKDSEKADIFHDYDRENYGIPINGLAHSLSSDGTYVGALPPTMYQRLENILDMATANNVQIVNNKLGLINEDLDGEIKTLIIDLGGIRDDVTPFFDVQNIPVSGKYVDSTPDLVQTPISAGANVLTQNDFYLNGSDEIIVYIGSANVSSLSVNKRYYVEGTITHNGNVFTNDNFVAQNTSFTGTGTVYECVNVPAYLGFKAYGPSFRGFANYQAGTVKPVLEMPNKVTTLVEYSRYSPTLGDAVSKTMMLGIVMSTDGNGYGNGDVNFNNTGVTNIRARYIRYTIHFSQNNAK